MTTRRVGKVWIRKVNLAGVTGIPFHFPGTGIACSSEAAATISMVLLAAVLAVVTTLNALGRRSRALANG